MGPQKSQTRLSTQAQWILQDRGLWALTSAKSQENQDKLVTLLSDPHSNRFYNPHFTGKETEAQRVMSFTQDHGDRWATQLALEVKNLPANAGNIRDGGSIPGSGRCPGGGHGLPLQCSCLENPMGRGAWWAAVHSITKSQT